MRNYRQYTETALNVITWSHREGRSKYIFVETDRIARSARADAIFCTISGINLIVNVSFYPDEVGDFTKHLERKSKTQGTRVA